MKKKSSSVSKTMGMLPPCNLRAAIFVVIQYSEYLRYKDICFVDRLEMYTLALCLADLCAMQSLYIYAIKHS